MSAIACLKQLVSNTDMRRAGLLIPLVLFGLIAYWCYQRVPWIDVAASIHSQRGSIDCGHVIEPDINGARSAIDCAVSAREKGRPFVVIFSVHGIDEHVSN